MIAAARDREEGQEEGEDDGATHLNLVIDARSEEPDGAERWGDPDADVGWVQALARALSIFPAQGLYEDMRRVERDNRPLDRVDEIVEEFGRDLSEDRRAELRERVEDVAGVSGKRHVEIDLISPLVMASETGESVPELLAGEHLGDFSGFLDEELRRSDFTLGYECSLIWAREGLTDSTSTRASSTARSRRSRRAASTTGTRSAAAAPTRATSRCAHACAWRRWPPGPCGRCVRNRLGPERPRAGRLSGLARQAGSAAASTGTEEARRLLLLVHPERREVLGQQHVVGERLGVVGGGDPQRLVEALGSSAVKISTSQAMKPTT